MCFHLEWTGDNIDMYIEEIWSLNETYFRSNWLPELTRKAAMAPSLTKSSLINPKIHSWCLTIMKHQLESNPWLIARKNNNKETNPNIFGDISVETANKDLISNLLCFQTRFPQSTYLCYHLFIQLWGFAQI